MNTGIVLLVILASVTLFQVLFQGYERRKQHRELMERLEKLGPLTQSFN